MSKTAEETLLGHQHPLTAWTSHAHNEAIQAMHAYAEERAVEFAEWVDKNCEKTSYRPYSWWYRPTAAYYSASDLYQLFIQQNKK